MARRGRGVAQLGSALGSGPRGREFKSPLPDQSLAGAHSSFFPAPVWAPCLKTPSNHFKKTVMCALTELVLVLFPSRTYST